MAPTEGRVARPNGGGAAAAVPLRVAWTDSFIYLLTYHIRKTFAYHRIPTKSLIIN